MCGIVGYIGNRHPKDILLEGLKCLEYRGYDSAGVAFKNSNSLQVIKTVGKLISLEEVVNNTPLINCNMGIGHTRWATHGVPSDVNAHPHTVGNVTLVHNGIIENAAVLREQLMSDGVVFNSETDTEVACALINKYYDGDAIDAIDKSLKEIKGSYAFVIMFSGDDRLYAIRKDSPLIVGIGEDEYFVASDITAISSYTNKYILLDEKELVVLDRSGFIVSNDGVEICKEISVFDTLDQSKDKCGYPHYMIKEIMEEPIVLEKTLNPYIDNIGLLPDLSLYEEIHIVGCGSAMYAGMIGKSLLEEKSNIRVYCEIASEYRYKKVFYDKKTLVILISQSGETADTIAAMRKAKDNGVDTLAIVNVKTSTIARESDKQIFIEAGPEIAVATTKAYILQVAILALLSYKVSLEKGLVSSNLINEIRLLPKLLLDVLNRRDLYLKIARSICRNNSVFFIGRKIDYAISLEGSLKLKEVSYIHSEAYQAGELKHGTISLIEDGLPVFAIITDSDIKDKTLSNLEEVKSRGAKTIIISNEKVDGYDLEIIVPKISDYFQSILVVPCLQLIAYEVARLRGCDIDKPKNLAKSVTVE